MRRETVERRTRVSAHERMKTKTGDAGCEVLDSVLDDHARDRERRHADIIGFSANNG